ncbi:TetR family transcriptional regulator [Aeromicrobium sp. PE09-221]|uniref:TetR/AcrR family transcriptional regulator n=1 Tax=Aeromicrobium sp. PE09-221 TaxID=1898043 RepID=UPI000B3E522C|nr:TetR/AcrR family transcriptional regulator [Aeromicrobium sp. PE09-221]OUZ07632.1 TetR family transcriptional regulator [Aeromicrobium sp. PE09-221]
MHDPPAKPTRRIAVGGRKVGRKPAFTADDVVAAAIAEGVDRFTLAAVADRLGVVTTAIYRLFPSREDLVIACLDAAGATIALPEPSAPWRDTLRRWADECWRLCEDYPGLSRLVYAYPTAPTRIERVFRAYADSLSDHGKSPRQTMFALDFLGDTVFASHLGVEAMRSVDEKGRTGLQAVRDAIRDPGSPLHPQESWAGRTVLDAKIEFILTGLEQNWPEF